MTEPGGQREGGPVTIAHIAETAGVSVPTVSKVLNGRSGVSDKTRARVEELIERYGYRKPPAKGNDILELLFHELAGMRAVEVIRGVEQVARKHRFGVVISEAGPGGAAATAVDDLVERRPRAVLAVGRLSGGERDLLKTRGIPFLVLDPVTELPDDVPFVGATDWRGGQTATQHLIKLGHRSIAVISEPDQLPCRARLAGFHSATQVAGLSVDPELVVSAPPHPRGRLRRRGRSAGARRPPHRDLRIERSAGTGRLPRRARGGPSHPAGPERGRVRRPAGRGVGRAAADHRAPATGRDGRSRRRTGPEPGTRRGTSTDRGGDGDHAHRPRKHCGAPRQALTFSGCL